MGKSLRAATEHRFSRESLQTASKTNQCSHCPRWWVIFVSDGRQNGNKNWRKRFEREPSESILVPPAGLEPATRGLGIRRKPSHGVSFVPHECQFVPENDHLCALQSLHITVFIAQYGNKMATIKLRETQGGHARRT